MASAELRRVEWRGLPIVVENEPGTFREWTDGDGRSGRTFMRFAYGFFADHIGSDGDELDCYLGPDPSAAFVHVVHQLTPTGARDEDKCLLDFADEAAAKAAFLQHRDDGERCYGGMSTIPVEAFIAKLQRRTSTGKIRHSRMTAAPEAVHTPGPLGTRDPKAMAIGDESTESLALRLYDILAAGRGVTDFHAAAIIAEFKRRGIRTFPQINAAVGRTIFMSTPRLFSIPSFRFGLETAIGKWSRLATFGVKEKDGARMEFNADTLGQMVDNAAARGDAIAICNDHASAYPETKDAPALGFFGALAVVSGGKVAKAWNGQPDPAGLDDGLYARLDEITPRGNDPTVGLGNYRYLSPFFMESARDQAGKEIGFALFDAAATNTPFQDGCAIQFHAMPGAQAMASQDLRSATARGETFAPGQQWEMISGGVAEIKRIWQAPPYVGITVTYEGPAGQTSVDVDEFARSVKRRTGMSATRMDAGFGQYVKCPACGKRVMVDSAECIGDHQTDYLTRCAGSGRSTSDLSPVMSAAPSPGANAMAQFAPGDRVEVNVYPGKWRPGVVSRVQSSGEFDDAVFVDYVDYKGEKVNGAQFPIDHAGGNVNVRKLSAATTMADPSKADWERALAGDEEQLRQLEAVLPTLRAGGKDPSNPNLSLQNAERSIAALKQVIQNKKALIARMSTSPSGEPAKMASDWGDGVARCRWGNPISPGDTVWVGQQGTADKDLKAGKIADISGRAARVQIKGGGMVTVPLDDLVKDTAHRIQMHAAAPSGNGAVKMGQRNPNAGDFNVGDKFKDHGDGSTWTVTEKRADRIIAIQDGSFSPVSWAISRPMGTDIEKMSAAQGGAVRMAQFNPGDRVKVEDGIATGAGWSGVVNSTGRDGYGKTVTVDFPNGKRLTYRPDELQRMSRTPGAARRMSNQGAKKMDPTLMTKLGFAEGAQPTVDEKMAACAKYAMSGEATDEEIKAMAADLEALDDEKAKKMAQRFGDLVIKHEDEDEPPAMAALMARVKASEATAATLSTKLSALQAAEDRRTAEAAAEADRRVNKLADDAVAGGYPKDARDALVLMARTDYAAAEKLVRGLIPNDPQLFSRTVGGGAAPAGTPGVKRSGGVVRYGMDLSAKAHEIAKAEKVTFSRGLELAAERHPELVRAYEAHQA